jgi:cytochrome c-type biogenesis protein CcmH/NrfF
VSRRLLTVALLAITLVTATTAPAFAATPRVSFNDIENELMCVACGVPLQIAESPQADRERAYIHRLIDRGLTKDQIKAELVATYTDRVLATPKHSGFGLTAYLVPIILVLAALAGIAVALRRWRRNRDDADHDDDSALDRIDAPELTDADARRLDADLARYEV